MTQEEKYMKAAIREAKKAYALEEFMRLCTMAPAHIWHGSSVTYIVQSSSRQSPVFLLAFLIAVSSACASVFPSVFLLL